MLLLLYAHTVQSENATPDRLAMGYFVAWQGSQKPDASTADLESFLSYLADDVAWQHLPYATSDERIDGGKEKLRKGMTTWLGNHKSYQASLIRSDENEHYIILEFRSEATIEDDASGVKVLNRHYMDVLELENRKVAIIRRYDLSD